MVLTELQKYEILIKHKDGKSNLQIAKEMKINKNTVNLWLTRYKKLGNVKRQRGSGLYKNNTDSQIFKKINVNDYCHMKT